MRKVVINQDGHICDEHLNLLHCPLTGHLCDHRCVWFSVSDYTGSGYEVPIESEVMCGDRVVGIIIAKEKPHLRCGTAKASVEELNQNER